MSIVCSQTPQSPSLTVSLKNCPWKPLGEFRPFKRYLPGLRHPVISAALSFTKPTVTRLTLLSIGKWTQILFANNFTTLRAQMVRSLPAIWKTCARSLVWDNPLEKEMAIHSSILAWEIPWIEEPGRLQSMGSQRVSHNEAISLYFFSLHVIS